MTDSSDANRHFRILSRLPAKERDSENHTTSLCELAAELTNVTGAGIMIMSDNTSAGSLCSSNKVSSLIEDLQFSLGEGPCVDAYNKNTPVLEPDLIKPKVVRWSAFTRPAVDAGVRAIFGYPLRSGTVRLGALNLYCDHAGPLSDDQHAYALAIAEVAAQTLLASQSSVSGDSLAPELEVATESSWVVHQASGMVSVQLDIDVDQALARIQAYGFANNHLVYEVAEMVVSRQLRFNDSQETQG